MALAALLTREMVRSGCIAPRSAEAPGTPDTLSALERTVVAIGAADARQGLWIGVNPDTRLHRLTSLLLGRRSPATLADPRLDALRRFAQAAAYGRERIGDFRRVRDAGFNPAQIVLAARLSRGAPNLH